MDRLRDRERRAIERGSERNSRYKEKEVDRKSPHDKDYVARSRGSEGEALREISMKRATSKEYSEVETERRGKRSREYDKPSSDH